MASEGKFTPLGDEVIATGLAAAMDGEARGVGQFLKWVSEQIQIATLAKRTPMTMRHKLHEFRKDCDALAQFADGFGLGQTHHLLDEEMKRAAQKQRRAKAAGSPHGE